MSKPKPCRHSRRAVIGYEARAVTISGGEFWRVKETLRCASCGEESHRWSRKGYLAASARESLRRYGAPTEALPPPPNYKPRDPRVPPQDGLWPFPSIDNPLVPLKEGR